ncbi:hypothetical protein DL93DRAFT_1997572 [Clavulina sp. PMI_390]|nr:hypothetical protein DL93DRAFT_1997572 [Clavulina sp. PMI_390]
MICSEYMKTCKLFHNLITKSRFVWAAIVNQQSLEDNLAPFSIPVAKMSITELVHQASRRHRLRKVLARAQRRQSNDSLPNLELPEASLGSQFTLVQNTSNGSENILRPRRSRLLPGGRWYLGLDIIDDRGHLACWDLHRCVEGSQSPPVAVTTSKLPFRDFYPVLNVQLFRESVTILLASLSGEVGTSEWIEVVVLSWEGSRDELPHFEHPQPPLSVPSGSGQQYCLDGELVLIVQGRRAKLWYWTLGTDRMIEWDLVGPQGGGATRAILQRPLAIFAYGSSPHISVYHVHEHPSPPQLIDMSFPMIETSSTGVHRLLMTLLDCWSPPSPDRETYIAARQYKPYRRLIQSLRLRLYSLNAERISDGEPSHLDVHVMDEDLPYSQVEPATFQRLPDALGLITIWEHRFPYLRFFPRSSTDSDNLEDLILRGTVHLRSHSPSSSLSVTLPLPKHSPNLLHAQGVENVAFCIYSGVLLIAPPLRLGEPRDAESSVYEAYTFL